MKVTVRWVQAVATGKVKASPDEARELAAYAAANLLARGARPADQVDLLGELDKGDQDETDEGDDYDASTDGAMDGDDLYDDEYAPV